VQGREYGNINALQAAVHLGDRNCYILQFVIEQGANVGEFCENALQAAISLGDESIVSSPPQRGRRQEPEPDELCYEDEKDKWKYERNHRLIRSCARADNASGD
jgi:hypothetical protein